MRHAVILAITALLPWTQAFGEPIALVADRVIDGIGDRARTDTVVVVVGERIVAVGKDKEVSESMGLSVRIER